MSLRNHVGKIVTVCSLTAAFGGSLYGSYHGIVGASHTPQEPFIKLSPSEIVLVQLKEAEERYQQSGEDLAQCVQKAGGQEISARCDQYVKKHTLMGVEYFTIKNNSEYLAAVEDIKQKTNNGFYFLVGGLALGFLGLRRWKKEEKDQQEQ